ncbi:MAG: Flp pilus assembly protein CpaB [Thermoleophilaceae bacterium]|nr:Flp pilus assembly protein CpaB [Thermoleophilaceae bacterium]
MSGRRRRALVLLALALACGGLAASQVRQTVEEVEERTGAPVSVLVARESLPADREIDPGSLAVKEVPERYAPRDGLTAPRDAAGLRTSISVSAGSYLTAGHLQGGSGRGAGGLRRGERALEIAVAGGEALAGASPGSTVDVLVSTEGREAAGRTFLALESVELLDLRPGAGGAGAAEDSEGSGPVSREGAAATATATATLRVSTRQAVYLTAAQNFAREVRLLPRPAGDRGRAGRASVDAGGL